jgi:hypothetical protein
MLRGAETDIAVRAYRQRPGKYAFVGDSGSVGEIREVYNGKKSFMQTDIGLDQELYPGVDTSRYELFSTVFNPIDPDFMTSLKFEGEADLDGRQVNVLTGVTDSGVRIGMAFEVSSKLLVRYTLLNITYNVGDYRQTGPVKLPFAIEIEKLLTIQLDTVTLNPEIDPAKFEKKERCFDKPN